MHRFKSANLAERKNCQNGTFEPVHGIKKTPCEIVEFKNFGLVVCDVEATLKCTFYCQCKTDVC